MNFGYPYCHAGTIADPEYGGKHSCAEFTAAAQKLGPHVASLGMRFYTGTQFPARLPQADIHRRARLVEPQPEDRLPRLGRAGSKAGKAISYQPFATGWLQGEQAWGRPADVLVMPDGSLLVSDDYAGAIYRISYAGPR